MIWWGRDSNKKRSTSQMWENREKKKIERRLTGVLKALKVYENVEWDKSTAKSLLLPWPFLFNRLPWAHPQQFESLLEWVWKSEEIMNRFHSSLIDLFKTRCCAMFALAVSILFRLKYAGDQNRAFSQSWYLSRNGDAKSFQQWIAVPHLNKKK